jgi:hypothetical protein
MGIFRKMFRNKKKVLSEGEEKPMGYAKNHGYKEGDQVPCSRCGEMEVITLSTEAYTLTADEQGNWTGPTMICDECGVIVCDRCFNAEKTGMFPSYVCKSCGESAMTTPL